MVKTKILATIGPVSESKIEQMVKAGLDGVRLNMTHVKDYAATGALIKSIRSQYPGLFIVADLEGPKIRLGNFDKFSVSQGQAIRISRENECPAGDVPVRMNELYKYVQPGNTLLIDDGKVGLKVTDIKDKTIIAEVEYGEEMESRKGINIPGIEVPMDYLSERDPQHLAALRKWDVDYVFASYTLNAEHMQTIAKNLKGTGTKVGGKPENWTGLNNLDKIMKKAGIMMVPRGDLGMEIGVMNVPEWQEKMILKCNIAGRPVIVATQMLESMMTSKEPKRAEVSDISYACKYGADVVMLSGETSVGQYPVEAIRMMNQILEKAEKDMFDKKSGIHLVDLGQRLLQHLKPGNPADDISRAVYAVASKDPSIKAIIAPTMSGYTPRMISRFRMETPIVAITNNASVYRQLNAVWGVTPVYQSSCYPAVLEIQATQFAAEKKLVKPGDKVIVTAGLSSKSDKTHIMRIETV
ncbi:pyruvate kinase [Candidatus Woesearchaeota archaeon]|nr:pyruvate kinase [Candidatus Woesearchaeota archaeon]